MEVNDIDTGTFRSVVLVEVGIGQGIRRNGNGVVGIVAGRESGGRDPVVLEQMSGTLEYGSEIVVHVTHHHFVDLAGHIPCNHIVVTFEAGILVGYARIAVGRDPRQKRYHRHCPGR